MGDPKKTRKKYKTPSHPWQKTRLEDENEIAIAYGLKNKEEIWKMLSVLKGFTNQHKTLVALSSDQAKKERTDLMDKLSRLGLLAEGANPGDILNLTIRDVLERRLQTFVFRKGFAKSAKQARQFIVHEHIMIGDKPITSPSYLVNADEEAKITFVSTSALASTEHPERYVDEGLAKKPKKGEETEESSEEKPVKEDKKEAKKDTKTKKEPKEKKSVKENKKEKVSEEKPAKEEKKEESKAAEAKVSEPKGEDKKEEVKEEAKK